MKPKELYEMLATDSHLYFDDQGNDIVRLQINMNKLNKGIPLAYKLVVYASDPEAQDIIAALCKVSTQTSDLKTALKMITENDNGS